MYLKLGSRLTFLLTFSLAFLLTIALAFPMLIIPPRDILVRSLVQTRFGRRHLRGGGITSIMAYVLVAVAVGIELDIAVGGRCTGVRIH